MERGGGDVAHEGSWQSTAVSSVGGDEGTVRHRVAGRRQRQPRRSSVVVGLIGLIGDWQAAGLDLELIGPTATSGRRSPQVVEGCSPHLGCRVPDGCSLCCRPT
jgi:hypothetical protein